MFEMRYMGLPKGSSICFQPQREPGSLTPGSCDAWFMPEVGVEKSDVTMI